MLKQKIPVIIIEKNQQGLTHVIKLLKKTDEISVIGTATNGKKGMSLILNLIPQLIFVNTDLPDVNGLDLVREIYKRDVYPEFVFVAENDSLAFKSLQCRPLDFWVKPIGTNLVFEMVERLKFKLKKKELIRKMDIFTQAQQIRQKRVFRQKKGIVIIYNDEIVYCKTELTSTRIVLNSNKEILVKSGIKETLDILNSDDFMKVSRSLCINRNYVRKFDKRNVKCILAHGKSTWQIPVSKKTMLTLEKLNVYPFY